MQAGTDTAKRGRQSPRGLTYALGGLLAFIALNAIGGGYYGLRGARGVPKEWLAGSPFSDYLVPSLILMFVVGGAFSLAALAVFRHWPRAAALATGAGVLVMGWLGVQVAILGFVSWMQPATAVAGLLVLYLASELSRRSPDPSGAGQSRSQQRPRRAQRGAPGRARV